MTQFVGLDPVSSSLPTQCFSVVADTDPSALPRVLEVFSKLSMVPFQCHSSRVGSNGQELHIDLQFAHMDMQTAEHLARTLRGIFLVNSVLTSEKRDRMLA
jgi:hypothetical protein